MIKKPNYIKKIELEEGVLSIMENGVLLNSVDKIEKNKNIQLLETDSYFQKDKLIYNSKLYKSQAGFYIYWKRHLTQDIHDKYELYIFHKPENINEIIIFLKIINK